MDTVFENYGDDTNISMLEITVCDCTATSYCPIFHKTFKKAYSISETVYIRLEIEGIGIYKGLGINR